MVVFVLIALVSWMLNNFKPVYCSFIGLLLRTLPIVSFACFYWVSSCLVLWIFEFFVYSGYESSIKCVPIKDFLTLWVLFIHSGNYLLLFWSFIFQIFLPVDCCHALLSNGSPLQRVLTCFVLLNCFSSSVLWQNTLVLDLLK